MARGVLIQCQTRMAPVEGRLTEPTRSLTILELRRRADAFRTEFLQGMRQTTVETYGRSLLEFIRWAALQGNIIQIDERSIDSYISYLTETRGLSDITVGTYLTALRRFCDYLVDFKVILENPTRHIKGAPRRPLQSREVLTEREVTVLLDSVDITHPIGRRDLAFMACMLYAGLNEIELIAANVGDLDPTLMGWYLHLRYARGKRRVRIVPLDATVTDPLRAYMASRGRYKSKDPLFVSHGHRSEGDRLTTRTVRSRISANLAEAGILRRGISPNSLTLTALLLWLNGGMELDEVRQRVSDDTLRTRVAYFKKRGLLRREIIV